MQFTLCVLNFFSTSDPMSKLITTYYDITKQQLRNIKKQGLKILAIYTVKCKILSKSLQYFNPAEKPRTKDQLHFLKLPKKQLNHGHPEITMLLASITSHTDFLFLFYFL